MTPPNIPLGHGAEFDVVRGMLSRWGALAQGVGDDAALLDVPAGARLAVSTDVSVENVHFRREWLGPEEIAHRAVAAALSDLAAMGAAPLGMVIAMTLNAEWRASVPALADGLGAAARELGARILGGDLSEGAELTIGVTVLGAVEHALTRAGARAGLTLWVTGRLGGPLLALRALEQGRAPLPAHRERFAHPVPRLREARWLAAHGATAAIDVSDGVAADASHVAAASGVRIVLDLDRLPLFAAATVDDAARSGEEYELLFTAPASLDAAEFEREFGLPMTAIGRVEAADASRPGDHTDYPGRRGSTGGAGAGVECLVGGQRVPLPRGHSHFSG